MDKKRNSHTIRSAKAVDYGSKVEEVCRIVKKLHALELRELNLVIHSPWARTTEGKAWIKEIMVSLNSTKRRVS